MTDTPLLRSLGPGQPHMKPNTAVGLVLLGFGAILRYNRAAGSLSRALARGAGVVVLLIGTLTLAEYATLTNLHIDELMFADVAGPNPGRPSPPTALALSLLAAALLLFDSHPTARVRPSEWLILAAGFVAYIALLGFAFGTGALYRLPSAPVTGVAAPTAMGLLAIAAGMLLVRSDAGFMQWVTSTRPGGILLRRFVPLAILTPLLLNVVIAQSFAIVGLQEVSLMFALLVASLTLLGIVVMSFTAVRLNREHQSLEASRGQVRELVERAPDGILVADADGRYTEVNQTACRMLGYSRDELVGTTTTRFLAADLERLWPSGDARPGDSGHVVECTLRRKDGTPLPVEVSAVILPDGRRQAIVRDITERTRTREELHQTQERLELALWGSDLATWDWSICTGEVRFNARWAEMRGFERHEVASHVDTWLSGIHPEDLARVREALEDCFQGRSREYATELRVSTKLGEWIWILDRGKVVARDPQGRPIRMVGTELDITARKLAEAQLRSAEARSTGILSVSADAIISTDAEQRITLFNAGAERIFGYASTEVLGASLDILIPEPLRSIHHEHVARFASSREVARRMGERGRTIVGRRKNGEEFPADAAISRIDVDGKSVLTVALRDVTEQKRLEDDLRRAVRSRDEVVGIVAHDLRNPLSNIVIQAGILRRGDSLVALHSSKVVATIERAAKRMDRLIRDLLDVTSLEAGHLSVGPTRVAVADAVGEVLETQRPLAMSAGREIHLEVAPGLPEIWADRDRLEQVFENLIGNAVKFTEPGGRITIGAAPRAGDVLFWVADTGMGIAAQDLPHVFDRFWQGDKARRTGAGLGLPIVKGIIESHGGRVWVESAEGRGSTFFFTIPTAPCPTASCPTEPARS